MYLLPSTRALAQIAADEENARKEKRKKAPKTAKSYQATVIVEPRGRGGACMIINGRTFVLRGGIVRGLRELEE